MSLSLSPTVFLLDDRGGGDFRAKDQLPSQDLDRTPEPVLMPESPFTR
jgi:hypothetical protein